jgi:hypothetical protein|tara:strand:+ start:603 stop:845 length:243 start_codon:yes stop_codon:yes gene_type:complete
MAKKVAKRKPRATRTKLSYELKLSKIKRKVRWRVIERPTGSIITESEFEDDAKKICDFHNKHKQWEPNGGIVKFLTLGKI